LNVLVVVVGGGRDSLSLKRIGKARVDENYEKENYD